VLYGVPATAVKAQDLAATDLSKFNVIVLPDGQAGYGRVFGNEVERLKNWAGRRHPVCIKGAAAWASGERVNLTTARDRYATPSEEKAAEKKEAPRRIDVVPGSYVRLDVDAEHYLGIGVVSPIVSLFRSNVIFTPTKRGALAAVISKERPLVAGFTFDEAREPLKGAPFV
jgi:hypothetical protein